MKILVVGNGGREHALVWKLAQSRRVTQISVAPGNGGTGAFNLPIQADDIAGLLAHAQTAGIDLTVVGPEIPLAAGIVDAFQAAGLRIFGPTQAAAQLENSKAFAKEIMRACAVPTAQFATFDDLELALEYARSMPFANSPACVIKADGLAAGKGVFVCDTLDEVDTALTRILIEHEFGDAGSRVLIEERLSGPELSVLAFCDGKCVALMPPARDHKRVGEGDTGPNTGGMGAFAPAPDIAAELLTSIRDRVLQPVVDGMRARGTPYVGVLYAGLMLTPNGLRVLEFNCRFGDPETQVLLPLLESDLLDIFEACIAGRLVDTAIRWSTASAATVVLAAPGYPGPYPKNLPIHGLDTLPPDIHAFHAGTALREGTVVSTGGRVLNITATGATLNAALDAAYRGVAHIAFEGMQYRRDIGRSYVAPNSYAASGVDISAGNRAVELMKASVNRTHDARVLAGLGAFGGMFDASALKSMAAPVLVASTDGVGTKTMIAARAGRWDTIGQDLVNHCVNDILTQGATPLFFMDYVAAAKLDAERVATVVAGMAMACVENSMALLGGETAEMPGVYCDGELDVAGTIIGVVDRERAISGQRIELGDVLLSLPSTGLHTNGYSLARKALAGLNPADVHPALGKSIDDALLAVHRSYLPFVRALQMAGVDIHGMAHITGGGLIENVPRVLPKALAARFVGGSWVVPELFTLIQELGGIDIDEMYRVFNMGIGMVIVVPSAQADVALRTAGPGAALVGAIELRQEHAVLID